MVGLIGVAQLRDENRLSRFSEFLPLRYFGVLATVGAHLALVGEVLIFPSPIARFSPFSSAEAQP